MQINEYLLMPGYIYLSRDPVVISAVIGSGVAVSLWDRRAEFGGMLHYLYPAPEKAQKATAAYGNAAIGCLARMFVEEGSKSKDIQAQIFGGATNSTIECTRIAQGNVEAARKMLKKLGLKIISEDVGGGMGRKLVYNTFSNEAIVCRVKKLRDGDWYPYNTRDDDKCRR